MLAGWVCNEGWHMGGRHGHHFGKGRWRRGFERGGLWEDWPGEARARRGDIKYFILEALAERPMHGYDVMRVLEERHGGAYRPSPGSVYPTLQMLEDGGFVTSEQAEGKRVYTITDAGRQLLAGRTSQESSEDSGREARVDLRVAAVKLAAAVVQAARSQDGATESRAKEILDRARRDIYKLLSEDEDSEPNR